MTPPVTVRVKRSEFDRVFIAGDSHGTIPAEVDNYLVFEIRNGAQIYRIAAGRGDPIRYAGAALHNLMPSSETLSLEAMDLSEYVAANRDVDIRVLALDYGVVGRVSDVFVIIAADPVAIISAHSGVTGLDEDALGRYLARQWTRLLLVLAKLDHVDRDDVALAFLRNVSEARLSDFLASADGPRGAALLLAELADGSTSKEEEVARDRLLALMPNDRPATNTILENSGTDATAVIRRHTSGPDLREEELGGALLRDMPANSGLVASVLDELGSTDRDDVAFAIMKAATDTDLTRIANNAAGRAVLGRFVQEMFAGDMDDEERAQMERAMQAISAPLIASGDPIEVEIITFLHGGGLDVVGVVLAGGSKGHTAIAVGGNVYSFELGWRAGMTRADYLAANGWRPAVGQVLSVPRDQAVAILNNLNQRVGEGTYAVSGDICSDATVCVLNQTLGKITMTADWNPLRLLRDISEQVPVERYRFYPKQQ